MPQRGPVTFDELVQVLRSTTDPHYLQPFFEQGYGSGLEAFEALCQVFARVSEACDRTTQGLYVLPWSGQSAPPATGPSAAQVTLQVSRGAARSAQPLTLKAGQVLYEEIATEWGVAGGVPTATGRRFTPLADFTFLPGELGPFDIDATATTIGYGPANVLPGTITGIVQPGSTFTNTRASVVQGPAAARLIVRPDPDVIAPNQVGQYVEFTAGANAGKVRRISGYEPADPGVPHGGVAVLAPVLVARNVGGAAPTAIAPGESVVQYDTATIPPTVIATGVALAVTAAAAGPPWYLAVERSTGEFQPTAGTIGPIVGVSSGGTFPVEDTEPVASLVDETGTASWRVLGFGADWGLEVTNPEAPTPGAQAMLDALGAERNIARAPGETDERYRLRVAKVADTISPNAIRRIGNRIWSVYGGKVCLREVGLPLLPGFYFDGDPGGGTLGSYPWDADSLRILGVKVGQFSDGERVYQDNGGILTIGRVTTTLPPAAVGAPVPPIPANLLELAAIQGEGFTLGAPIVGERSGATMVPSSITGGLRVQDRFKLLLDYTDFRAFFLLGVPASNLGEFGMAYGYGASDAYDAFPYLAFYDGFPLSAAVLYRGTWQAVDRARAGGVGFDLYVETNACQ